MRWAAELVGLRPEGFRRVGGQVCKRLRRRIAALGLAGPADYRRHVADHPGEREVIEALCRVHVSRFYRDAVVFDALRDRVLPALAAAAPGGRLRIWSAGCAAGEEPYTLALMARLVLAPAFPDLRVAIEATDADADSIERARCACYPPSSVAPLPAGWRQAAFERRQDGRHCLRAEYRAPVELRREDLRGPLPAGPFALILCRNLAFTYFAPAAQIEVAGRLAERLAPGGFLVIGARERLPSSPPGLTALPAVAGLYSAAPK